VEIASSVADGPYSVIMDQVTNGIAVRMAVLYALVAARKAERVARPAAAGVGAAGTEAAASRGASNAGRASRGVA
jgi:aspartate carbamoyltransferase catalytic subunit